MDKVKVTLIFPIREKQQIFTHLETPDWEFRSFGSVYLILDDLRIKMNYIGYGNIEGIPVIVLTPSDPIKVEEIAEIQAKEIYVERSNEPQT